MAPIDYPQQAKESLLAGIVALALTVPMMGLRTTSGQDGMVIDIRMGDAALTTLGVAVGHFVISLIRQALQQRSPKETKTEKSARLKSVAIWIGWASFAFALTLPVTLNLTENLGLHDKTRYYLDIGILVLTYVTVSYTHLTLPTTPYV